MKLTEEQVMDNIINGSSEAINAARDNITRLTNEVNKGLEDNKVEKAQYSVKLLVELKINVPDRKVYAKGGVGAVTANILEWGNSIESEIEDPNQPELGFEQPVFDNDQDLTGKKLPEPDEQ